jgi:hypothetical protein
MAERDWAEEARHELEHAAEPVRLKLEEIQTALDKLEEERTRLFQARRTVKGMLDRLLPPRRTAPKKKGTSYVSVSQAEKTALVRQWLLDHSEQYADGFTGAGVHRDMVAANGKGEISPSVVLTAIKAFHNAGFVRANGKVRGGAMQYKLVSQ